MHILITGAAGMLGRKLAERLGRDGALASSPVERLSLVDMIEPTAPAGFTRAVHRAAIDLAEPAVAASLAQSRPDIIYHLAAVVSGEAETDLEKGYRVNLNSMRQLLDAVRIAGKENGWCPRFVFASSVAVFGGDLPPVIGDDYLLTPQTSYGTQKAMCGSAAGGLHKARLRPGDRAAPAHHLRAPRQAEPGCFELLLRHHPRAAGRTGSVAASRKGCAPLDGEPRSAVGFLLHAGSLDLSRLGSRPNLTMPGLSVTVGEQIAALERVAGPKAVALIRPEHDPMVERIVRGWAQACDPARALGLGFHAEGSFDEIIQVYVEDEMGGRLR